MTYAPVPADCARRKGSALSRSLASGLASPPFWLASWLSIAPRLELDRIGSREGFGALSLRTTVKGSGARTSSTELRKRGRIALDVPHAVQRPLYVGRRQRVSRWRRARCA